MRAALRSYVAALHPRLPGRGALLPARRAGRRCRCCGPATSRSWWRRPATCTSWPRPTAARATRPGSPGALAPTATWPGPSGSTTRSCSLALALVEEARPSRAGDVQRVIGITDVIYHLSVAPGGGLAPHHAQHAGTGLANQHAGRPSATADTLRAAMRGQEALVDEFAVAERARPAPCGTPASRRPWRQATRRWPAPRPPMTTRRSAAPWSPPARAARGRPGPPGAVSRPASASPKARRDWATLPRRRDPGARERAQRRAAAPRVRPRRTAAGGQRSGPPAWGIAKSTAHRIVHTLAAEGLLERVQYHRPVPAQRGHAWCSGRVRRARTLLHGAATPVLDQLRNPDQEKPCNSRSSTAVRSCTSSGARARTRSGCSGRIGKPCAGPLHGHRQAAARVLPPDELDGGWTASGWSAARRTPSPASRPCAPTSTRSGSGAGRERQRIGDGHRLHLRAIRDRAGTVIAAVSVAGPVQRVNGDNLRRFARPDHRWPPPQISHRLAGGVAAPREAEPGEA